jgi:hypothetical protein
MDDDQFGIIMDVLEPAMAAAPHGWRELMIRYYVDDGQSAQVATCLMDTAQGPTEIPLSPDLQIDGAMRRLRTHLSEAGRPAFTQAKLHLTADGNYEADYGYDPVDWSTLLQPSWNFTHATH